jgi:hypothetical protein
MSHLQIAGIVLIVSAILIGLGFLFGKWFNEQMRLAELREWKDEWDNVKYAAPIYLPDTVYQPDPWVASEAYYHEWPDSPSTVTLEAPRPVTITDLKVTGPLYSPEAETRAYMYRQDEETREFLRQLREH